MKNFIGCSLAVIFVFLLIIGCKKEKSLDHTQVTEVSTLFTPENNKFLKLQPLSGTAVFEWAQAKAEDNGVVLYEVAFDKENGDFSKPLYSVSSDGNGLYNKLSFAFKDLNRIAEMAGIQPSGVGKIKWTVWSSKGINVKRSAVTHTLEIERPEGFSSIPADLFLTGAATEGNADLSKAVHFKQTAPGSFELYTSLKAGAYSFVERNSGSPKGYSLSGTNKLIEGGTTTVTGDVKQYRMVVDFNAASVTVTQIVSVGLWFAPDNKILVELPYKGNGQWEVKGTPVVFKQESWGRDERYKFRLTVRDAAGAQSTEDFGSSNRDNSRPDNSTASSYWYLKAAPTSQWDYCYKFNGNADNKNVDVLVDFSAAATAYTHTVTVK